MSKGLRIIGTINLIAGVIVALVFLISFREALAFVGFFGGIASAAIGSLLFFAMARILDDVADIRRTVMQDHQRNENGPETVQEVVAGQPGLVVRSLVPGGVAASSGVREGDIIIAYDGQRVSSDEEFSSAVAARETKEGPLSLTVIRGAHAINLGIVSGRLGITTDFVEAN